MKDKESILDIKDEKLGMQGMCVSLLPFIQFILSITILDHKTVFMEITKGCASSKVCYEFEYLVCLRFISKFASGTGIVANVAKQKGLINLMSVE